MKNQKKIGIVLSYLNLFINMTVNVLLTPALIACLGDDSYSIYKVMQSFAGPLIMFNLGISAIVTRAVIKYHVSDEHNELEKRNTLALGMIISLIMAIFVLCLSAVMYSQIPRIYGHNYSEVLINEGKRVFALFALSTIFNILTETFRGCVLGNEKYLFNTSIPLFRNLFRIGIMSACILLKMGAAEIAFVDFIMSLAVFVIYAIYSLFVLQERPKLTSVNKSEIISIASFAFAILLQTIVNQVNNNVDTMLLGAMVEEKSTITMYSSALVIYTVYNSLISVVAEILLPKASQLVERKASGKEYTDFVVAPGRFQAMLAIAIVIAFALFGKDFIELWIGTEYQDAYYIVLMLIIPVTIPLVENAAICILDASMKRIYRSGVLVGMAIANVATSIVLIRILGFWGAALGTVISLVIGHVFLMNLYYKKVFGMEIGRMFKEIFSGILSVGIIAGILCIPLTFIDNTILFFLVKCLAFVLIYGILLWRYGMKENEKILLIGRTQRSTN